MYEFNEVKHLHTLDGKPLTGVTTVLSVISKGDGLIQWSANCAVEHIKSSPIYGLPRTTENQKWEIDPKEFLKVCDEAKTAWKDNRDSAGTKGKDTHAEIESIIKEAIAFGGGLINPLTHSESEQVTHFVNWACNNSIKFLESEKNIYSKDLWIGGIVDFVYEKDGEVYIGDVKTAKSIYPTNFWQTSAYQYCLQEMGLYPKIKGFTIVRLGKDGSFETKDNYSYEDNIEGFKSALTIYRKLNAITPPKRKPPLKKKEMEKLKGLIKENIKLNTK